MPAADRQPPPDLSEVYDETTLAALDAWDGRRGGEPPPAPVPVAPRWRRSAASGAVVTSVVLGLRDVLEGEREEAVVREEDVPGPDPDQAVVVHLVPFDPPASVAVVRPWLLPSARG